MALQLPVAPAPVVGTDQTSAPWLAKPQLKPADCVPEDSVGAYSLLRRYGVAAPWQERIPREYFKMAGPERDEKIWALKRQLGADLVILGHHYQRSSSPTIGATPSSSRSRRLVALMPNTSSSAACTSWPRAPISSRSHIRK